MCVCGVGHPQRPPKWSGCMCGEWGTHSIPPGGQDVCVGSGAFTASPRRLEWDVTHCPGGCDCDHRRPGVCFSSLRFGVASAQPEQVAQPMGGCSFLCHLEN